MGETFAPIKRKLDETRRLWRMAAAASGMGWTLLAVTLLALICYHIDRWHPLTAAGRAGWDMTILLAALALAVISVVRAMLARISDAALAAQVEHRYPALKERLITAVSLAPAGPGFGSTGFSPAMMGAVVEEAARATDGVDFGRSVDRRPLRMASFAVVAAALLFFGHLVLVHDPFAVWIERMLHPGSDVAPYAATRVWIDLSADLIPRGATERVTVRTGGVHPNAAYLYVKKATDPTGPGTRMESEQRDGDNFVFTLPALEQSVTVYAIANDGRSNEREVVVEDRPALLHTVVRMIYPGYMHRTPHQEEDSGASITAPAGTRVELSATANKPLKSAVSTWNDGHQLHWRITGSSLRTGFAVTHDTSYRLDLTDSHGFQPQQASRYEVHAVLDQPPAVQITYPSTDIDLVPTGSLPLTAHATDDFGVDRMALKFHVERSNHAAGPAGSLGLPGPTGAPQADAAVRWSIDSAHAGVGDTLSYLVEAVDNDTLTGPHVGHSETLHVHVVGLAEMQQRMKEQLDDEARRLAAIKHEQQQSMELARQSSPAAREKSAQLQRAAAQETQELAQHADSISADLENNRLASAHELAERKEAAEALKSAATQHMPAAADALEQHKNSAEAARQQNAAQNDLERASQLLSRPPDASQLAQQATELALKQKELAESSRNLNEDLQALGSKTLSPDERNSMEVAHKSQQSTTAATQQLARNLEKAAQAARDHGQADAAKAMQSAADALRKSNVEAQQHKAESSLAHQDPKNAAPAQDKAADALQQAAQAARAAAGSSAPETSQSAAERLQAAADKLQHMANEQRQLAQNAANHPDAAQSKRMAAQQKSLEQQAAQTSSALKSSPGAQQSLANAQQNMSQAQQQMQSGNASSAASPASQAAQQLEKAADNAQRAAQRIRQEQMSAELADRAAYLAQVQEALRSATERLHKQEAKGPLEGNDRRELDQIQERQDQTQRDTLELSHKMPSEPFRQALRSAAAQMKPAGENLRKAPSDLGSDTTAAQKRASATLRVVADALKQQADAGQQQAGNQQSGGQQSGGSPEQQQKAAALGEMMLAKGMQQQLRQDTGALDRKRTSTQQNTPEDQREATRLGHDQRSLQRMTEHLTDDPDIQQQMNGAAGEMKGAADRLQQEQTDTPTQGHQDRAIQTLDTAIKQAQQQMQQSQQNQQSSQQGAPQPVPQPGQQGGNPPIIRLSHAPPGRMTIRPPVGTQAPVLTPRTQRALQEGQHERVPAEYQDVVDRYYKSLAQKRH
jgi:hypothetical protein